jgi:hypothetical protein
MMVSPLLVQAATVLPVISLQTVKRSVIVCRYWLAV